MDRLTEALSATEIETVRRALKAAVEGEFLDDIEFHTLMGVDREVARQVYEAWPRQTADQVAFRCAVINSMNNQLNCPHGMEDELATYVPEGRSAISEALQHLFSLGL